MGSDPAPIDRRTLLRAGLAALAVAGCAAPVRRAARTSPSAATTSTPSGTTSAPSGGAGATALSRPQVATEIGHASRTLRAVALTFHGAGDAATAKSVLGELERAHARGTVLAVGSWLEAKPRMARRILDGGHELGNHTLNHRAMRRLGSAAAYKEIAGCAAVLSKLTGSPGRWFRPSGTQHTTAVIRRAAAEAGYDRCLSYDVDSLDWTDPGPSVVVRTVLGAARGGSVVSMHLGHPGTVAALPHIIEGLVRRDLRPVTVSELFA